MFCRFVAASLIVLSASLPASALTTRSMDDALTTAAARMKVKDYAGAHEAALKSSEKGSKAFLLGMSAVKLELWEEAATQLATAADTYPVLGDYALYYQGLALSKQAQYKLALSPLYKLLKQYPESRLVRPTLILYADSMAAAGYPKEALDSYTLFIERYPSGSDSISALFGSALCRDRLGDSKAASTTLRTIWINYPSSPYATKAATELERIAAAGTPVAPYTMAELFKRAGTLANLGRNKDAASALAALPLDGQSLDFRSKVQLKLGQAQFKSRHYQDAQATLRSLAQTAGSNETRSEANFWLAKALDKSGRGEEAFDLYLHIADPPKSTSVADDALLEAAYLRRFQRKWAEALQLFKKYLAAYPGRSNYNIVWEAAWTSYLSRDYQGAAAYFKKLTDRDDLREKALYWLGKSLAASGDSKGADAAFAALGAEYPFGYYSLLCNRWCDVSKFPTPPKSLVDSLPMPSGFEREKALIALGLYDEATRELLAKRGKNPNSIARLYLEMGNYNGAYHTLSRDHRKRIGMESVLWGVNYPLAYHDAVAQYAAANAVPDSLVYAVMRTESNYLPTALSPVGAVGLMQIMPATAEKISKGGGSRLTNPDLNIRLGTKHLKYLLSSFDKNLPLVIAAYNAGSGNVGRWQKAYGTLPPDEFVESIPFRETREYVKKVMTAMELYQRLYRLPPYKQ